MNSHRRTAAMLVAALLTTLAACTSETDSGADKPAAPSANEQAAKTAHRYLRAWLATEPADATAMCRLQTRAARPNFDDDGGTLKGCVTESTDSSQDTAASRRRGALTIKISNVQDVPASDTHPAGKGVLATLHRPGEDQNRYALRVVKEGDQWLIEQTHDVGERYAHTADPVAPVLAAMD
ncbi:hypothetical protein ACIG3E_32830 [Streptomyces sp. NPDC053474]|uniref:hypothetical protein n=1 Tax=Streptomyces sp. NPDC053474 TaxID=3365704 RepID=UPI0037D12D5A